jgi:hypothetical protein
MALKTRTEMLDIKDTVQLTATFRNETGAPTDLDSFPQITIIQPSGLVSVGPTSAGIMQVSTGRYQFNYEIGFSPGSFGVWIDNWVGYLNGFRIEASFNFVVAHTDLPALNTDGYYHLGDDPGFDYSQCEIFNINKLLKTFRARLNSRGKSKSKDAFGNTIYVDCDVFSTDMLVTLLANSITLFNEIPHFTFFTFADTAFIDQFHDVLVEGAVIWALGSQALIERGREQVISDNGISFTPPTISELLNTQATTLLTFHMEKLKFIKNSFKPFPLGMGSFSILGGINPQVRRLRHLRQRQLL